MNRRQLPIGIQDFRTIRENPYYYVDKTPLIRRLVEGGRHYFLSRPRRFGKSLLLDTLRELFAGNEPLFRGLDIHGRWDWSVTHPVVRLSFGAGYHKPGELEADILAQLDIIEGEVGLDSPPPGLAGPGRLRNLLARLGRKAGKRVVVLVDEYDKPILDALDDQELARANRDYLRGFYGVVKDSAEHVRFVFVTGITMFSKVSLFSGLNNLWDISLDPRFATLCGYTDGDLDEVFAPELPGLDRDEIRRWYNGYHWGGGERLYNPFDVLLLFGRREFRSWWFETGSPTFLYRTLMEKGVSPLELENRVSEADLLSTFDVGDIGVDALLFQAGYLTIAGEERVGPENLYTLDYPNMEVRQSLNRGLLRHAADGRRLVAAAEGKDLCRLLAENDFEGFADGLRALFAGIPYGWHADAGPARYEAWYAGMLYACFQSIGADVRAEEPSSRGRADMVLRHGGQVFVLEFKMAREGESAEAALARALAQIRARGYADKYRGRGEPVHLVGAVFGRRERNLLAVRAGRP